MCGVAGSGKSSVAQIIAENFDAFVISTDAIREELWGDKSIQRRSDIVFQTAYSRIKSALLDGHSVIFDATNLTARDRRRVLHEVKNCHTGFNIAYYLTTPLNICLENNRTRKKRVPDEVVKRQFYKFEIPSIDEGWDKVINFIDSEIASMAKFDFHFNF